MQFMNNAPLALPPRRVTGKAETTAARRTDHQSQTLHRLRYAVSPLMPRYLFGCTPGELHASRLRIRVEEFVWLCNRSFGLVLQHM